MAVDDTVDDGSVGLWLWWWQLQAKLNGMVADAAVVWFLAFGCDEGAQETAAITFFYVGLLANSELTRATAGTTSNSSSATVYEPSSSRTTPTSAGPTAIPTRRRLKYTPEIEPMCSFPNHAGNRRVCAALK